MKRVLLSLFVFISVFANAQTWRSHPKKPYSGTDSCLVFQDSTKKFYRVKCSEIRGSGSGTVDSNFSIQVKYAESITKGQAVYVSGGSGTNIEVSKASNTTKATSTKTLGLAMETGATNHIARVLTEGIFIGVNTDTAAIGEPVWLGASGNLLFGDASEPVTPAYLVYIGVVTRAHATQGEIYVEIQNGFDLSEIQDVLITSPANNQVLTYESASGLWKNKLVDLTSINLDNGKIPVGDGTNKAFGRTFSGAITVDNLGVTTYNGIVPVTKGGSGSDLSATGGTSHFLKQNTVGANVSVSPIKSVDLDSLYTPLGRVITEDFTSSFSNFTNLTGNTATYSIVSNSIECVGGTTFTLTSGKRQSTFGRTTTQKWTITSDIIVGTIGTNTHGVGISLQSTVSTNRSVQFVFRLNTAKLGKLETYTDSDTSTSSPTYSITSTGISVLAGDRVRLTVTRLGNSYIFKAFNMTAGARYGSSITIEKNTFKTGALTPFTNPANGEFAFNICGGTHYFDNYYVDADEVKQAEIMWIGDSIIDFSNGMNISQGAPATLQKMINGRVVPYATGGCKVEDINPIDASRYKSKIVIISLSINNVTAGDDTTTYKTKVAALVDPLVDSGLVLGTSLFLTEIMPSSAASVLLHNQCLKNNYNTSLIRTYNSFNNGSGSIKTTLSSGDASHPNFAGLRLLAKIVYQDLYARGLVTPRYNDKPHDNTLYTTDNGSVYIGEKLSEPTSPVTITSSDNAINIRPSASYASRVGGHIGSTTKSNLTLRGGNYLSGSSVIATASGAGIVNLDSAGIKMFSDTSLTSGSSYTPTERFNIRPNGNVNMNGNVGIGGVASTLSKVSLTSTGGVSLRESGLEYGISDASTDKMIVYNGTSTDASFIPSIGGICNTSSARSAFQNVGFVTSGNDTGTEPLLKFIGFQTTSSTDPINGTLTVVTTRPIMGIYNRTTLLQTVLANGNVGIGNSSPTARLHVTSTTSPQLRVSYDGSNVFNLGVDATGLATFSGNGTFYFNGTVGIGLSNPTSSLELNGTLEVKSYTVATLPACSGSDYKRATVTDALAPAYDATVVGGGTRVIEVICNGTNWVCH